MTVRPDFESPLPDTAFPRFTVNLLLQPDVQPEVKFCEVKTTGFSSRFSFSDTLRLDQVFMPDVAQQIGNCVYALDGKNTVLSLPSFKHASDGITLAKAQIISRVGKGDEHRIILRFWVIEGDVSYAFLPEHRLETGLGDHVDTIASHVLDQIALPLTNVCSGLEQGLVTAENTPPSFLKGLQLNAAELQTQIELLRLFVKEKCNQTPVHLGSTAQYALPDGV